MILRYGEPDRVDTDSLVWYNNGPWKRTVVYSRSYGAVDATTPKTVIQQTITYRVPDDRFADVDSFDLRLVADRTRDELSFRSGSEKLNFLAINAADEIVRGRKTLTEARDLCHRQFELMQAGKSSPYVEHFLFPVKNANAWPR